MKDKSLKAQILVKNSTKSSKPSLMTRQTIVLISKASLFTTNKIKILLTKNLRPHQENTHLEETHTEKNHKEETTHDEEMQRHNLKLE